MNTKICVLTALAACIGLLLTGFPAGAGQIESSVTLSFSGAVQQTPTPTPTATPTPTPTPTPTEPYSYIINVSGSNVQMTDGTTGQIDYQSTNATQVVNNAIGNLTQGGNILIKASTYNLKGSIIGANKNNVGLYFEKGAILFVSNGMNAPAISLRNVNNWLIQDVTIDGNLANQANAAGEGGEGMELDGIRIDGDSSNNLVTGANISNCGVYGFIDFGNNHNGITNSLITSSGWNGITFGDGTSWGSGCAKNGYAKNNEIAYSGDVGISTYGQSITIQNNYVHDINGTAGWNNARWGIGIEGGLNAIITDNTVRNCSSGIVNSGFNNCTISDNIISTSVNNGIYFGAGSTYNIAKNNTIVGANGGITLTSATFNDISGNYVSQSIYSGFTLDSSSNNNTVSLNHIFDNSFGNASNYGDGMNISGSSNFISENQVFDTRSGVSRTQNYGIYVASNALNNILTGNNVYNNLYGQILDGGTGTRIS